MIADIECKFCGSKNLRKVGIYLSPNGDKQKIQCRECRRTFNAWQIVEEPVRDV